MRKFRHTAAVFALAATLLAGCGQMDMLKAKMAFKDANTLYQSAGLRDAAAEKYEEVIALANDDPTLDDAYFFLGNSYDQTCTGPTKRGEAANDALPDQGDRQLQEAAEKGRRSEDQAALPASTSWRPTTRQAAATRRRPSRSCSDDRDRPAGPGNYFVLAKIYEDNGDYERAEQTLVKAREMKPNDPAVYMQLAGFYKRQGDFDKMIDAVQTRTEKEPQQPRGVLHAVDLLLGKGVPRLQVE